MIQNILSILLLVSLILVIISQLFSWGSLDVDAKIGGGLISATAGLEAEFNEYSVNYNVETNRMGEVNKIEENKIFLTGMGDFQENVGELLDSFKDKEYTIKASTILNTSGREYTNITVQTHSELVPWWPAGMGQKCTITIIIDSYGSTTQKVQVDKVWFEQWSAWDDDIDDYTKKKIVWESSKNDILSGKGSSKSYSTQISIDSKDPRVGIVGRVNLTILDKNGNQIRQILPFASDSHPTTINIYSMEQGQFISIILMVLAFPFTIIGLVFGLLAIIIVNLQRQKRSKKARGLIIISAIFILLGLVFYLNGLNTLVDLLDSALVTNIRDGFELNTPIISLQAISVVLLFITFGLTFVKRDEEKIPEQEQITDESSKDKPTLVFQPIENRSKKNAAKVKSSNKKKKKT